MFYNTESYATMLRRKIVISIFLWLIINFPYCTNKSDISYTRSIFLIFFVISVTKSVDRTFGKLHFTQLNKIQIHICTYNREVVQGAQKGAAKETCRACSFKSRILLSIYLSSGPPTGIRLSPHPQIYTSFKDTRPIYLYVSVTNRRILSIESCHIRKFRIRKLGGNFSLIWNFMYSWFNASLYWKWRVVEI